MRSRTIRRSTRGTLAASLTGALLASACAISPFHSSDPTKPAALEALRTTQPQEVRKRWGDYAAMASRRWLARLHGEDVLWREADWVVPGAVMRITYGYCVGGRCANDPYLVQFNERESGLDFLYGDTTRVMTGRVAQDGEVTVTYNVGGTMDRSRYDVSNGTFLSYQSFPSDGLKIFRAISAQELELASKGNAGYMPLSTDEGGTASPERARKSEAAQAPAAARETLLKTKFASVGVGVRDGQLNPDKNGKTAPIIYMFEGARPVRVKVELRSDHFEPVVAVYDTSRKAPVATAAGRKEASLAAWLSADRTYVVVISSVDGKAGRYSLRIRNSQ